MDKIRLDNSIKEEIIIQFENEKISLAAEV